MPTANISAACAEKQHAPIANNAIRVACPNCREEGSVDITHRSTTHSGKLPEDYDECASMMDESNKVRLATGKEPILIAPSCGVCMTMYADIMLPFCGHSFCHGCVKRLTSV